MAATDISAKEIEEENVEEVSDAVSAAELKAAMGKNSEESVLHKHDVHETAVCRLTAEDKYILVRSVGEECIQEEELSRLLANKPNPVAYDGFEPSGRMHIAQV